MESEVTACPPPRRPQPPIIRWNYPEYLCWRYITLPQFVFQKEKAFSLWSSKTSASFEDRKWEADIPWIKSERTCTRRLRADVCNNNSANVKSLSAEVTAPAKADAQTPPQPKDGDGKKCSFKTIRRKGNRDFVFGPNRWSNNSPAGSENQRGFTPRLRPHTLQPNVWLEWILSHWLCTITHLGQASSPDQIVSELGTEYLIIPISKRSPFLRQHAASCRCQGNSVTVYLSCKVKLSNWAKAVFLT